MISIPHGTIKTENWGDKWEVEIWFQFHMVRLRQGERYDPRIPFQISIPHGTIKTRSLRK